MSPERSAARANALLLGRALVVGGAYGAVMEAGAQAMRVFGYRPIAGLFFFLFASIQAGWEYAGRRDRRDGAAGLAAAGLVLAAVFGALSWLAFRLAGRPLPGAVYVVFAAMAAAVTWARALERHRRFPEG